MIFNNIKQITLFILIATVAIGIILIMKGVFANTMSDLPGAFWKAFTQNLWHKISGG